MDTMRVGLHSNKLVHRAELLRFVVNPIVSLMISRPNMDVQEKSIDIQVQASSRILTEGIS